MADADFTDVRIDTGIQLFNTGDYFGCHDVLEEYWDELPTYERPFFQGLIQAAVAMFHFQEENFGGALRMYRSSRKYLLPFVPITAGIDVQSLLRELDQCFAELVEHCHRQPLDVSLRPELVPRILRSSPRTDAAS